jgi:two-component system sensor histidine kinase/response regulator
VDFFANLFDSSDFTPRWYCGSWTPGLGWLHILSDLGVWAAYVAIPCVLGYFVMRRKDVPFRIIFWLFVAFILACGTTHLMEALMFWWPAYRLAGLIKLLTAIVSWATVLALVPLVPQALAMRSPGELEKEIAERERAEEVVRESEERFRGTFENAAVGIAHVDRRHCCIRANEVFCDLVGYSPTEAVGKTIESVVYPDDLPANLARFDQVIRGELASFTMEKRFTRKDGEIVWAILNVSLQRDAAGQPAYCIVIAQNHSERKRLEEELRQAHARLDLAVRGSNLSIWECDMPDGRIENSYPTLINAWESLGYDARTSPSDFPSTFALLFHPDDQERVRRKLQELFASDGKEYESEYRVRTKDGSTRWHLARGTVLRNQEGRPVRFIGTSADITDLKRAEEALREGERRFRVFVDHASDAFFLFNDQHVILDVNNQACKSLGYAREQLMGMTPLDFDPDSTPDRLEELKRKLDDEQPMAFESRHRRSDGAVFPVEIRGQAFWEGGRRFTVALARDVTDRMRAEAALRESEERFRGTFENAAVGIAHKDLEGRFLRVNQTFCEIVGYYHDELLSKRWQEITHPDDLATSQSHYRPLLSGESSSFSLEKRYVRKDHSLVWVDISVSLQRDEAGSPAYAIVVIQDISERKRLEDELRKAKETAEAANRAKDEFLANVSHEIRTPMNAILGMTELALDTPLNEAQRQYLKTVKSAADNLLGIINDLLDFSKIEAGKLALDPADFFLRATLGDTLRTLAIRAHKKGLELVSHVQPDVPDALIGDAGRLRQVLLNLVGNAIKFTEEGEVVVRVEVASDLATAGDVGLRFTVRDTGIGIPSEKQESIFRAFEQEDASTTRRYGGTGLGLTIAARLVTLMGGTITVESQPGRGSSFAFTARLGLQLHPPQPVAARPPVLLYNLRVLIVDDNATNRQILEEWLRGWQMEPVARGDGFTALDALWHGAANGKPYALVLLDSRMPDTGGLTLAATIRERAELSATRVILLTSGDLPGDLARFRELRIDAHLLKPVQQEELLETIYRVMNRTQGSAPKVVGPAPVQDLPPAPVPVVTPLHVLVAEDNEFNAQLLTQLLARQGHDVRLASNGREALAVLGGGTFDLLLLDVHMPELDGFQVVRTIREREQTTGGHLPIIALTARSRTEDRERCLAAGMDEFLSKPVRPADLWTAIDRVVIARPPAERPSPDLLDSQVLLATCGSDAGTLEQICQTFRARLPGHLAAVREAQRDRDASRLREAAHKLCGMMSVFSSVAGGVASDLEDLAAIGQIDECRPLIERLQTMAEDLLQRAGGISVEALRQQVRVAGDHNRTSGP